MAIYRGREELVKSLNEAKRQNDKKGLEAEIKVGDILSKYLPDNTYIIAQPDISEKQPDFLIISPQFGFRIVEVKNSDIDTIDSIKSNGVIITKYGMNNPFSQVRSHVDSFKNYLVANHQSLGIGDPYKRIGYCVIHFGFSKYEFESKFASQLSRWSEEDKKNYYKYHLFSNQLNSEIVSLIQYASKFHNKGYYLSNQSMQDIVNSIKISRIKKDEDGFFEKFNEQDEKLSNMDSELKQIKDSLDIIQANTNQNVEEKLVVTKKTNRAVLPIIILLIAIGFMSFILLDNKAEDIGMVDNDTQVMEKSKDGFTEISATVSRFYHDANSGTKFLTLTDGKTTIEGVIFKDVKVPFIVEGNTYVFEGYIQDYQGEKELNITKVR